MKSVCLFVLKKVKCHFTPEPVHMMSTAFFSLPARLQWHWKPFAALAAREVYDLLAARAAVFVLEQQCLYNDADGLDTSAWHLFATARRDDKDKDKEGDNDNDDNDNDNDNSDDDSPRELAACLRVLLPDAADTDVRIGRVLTTAKFRGKGLGHALLARALAHIASQWPGVPVRLHAQAHLQKFYGASGFRTISDVHDDVGIAHVWMRLA
jgi:ElaA protein